MRTALIRRATLALSATAAVCALSTAVHAEDEPASEPMRIAVPRQEPSPAAQAQHRDASIDRGIGSGHAETIGKNNWTVNSYELFLIGVTYGFTEDFQLSLTTMLPVFESTPFILALAPKYVVSRSDSVVVALRSNIWFGTDIGRGNGLGLISVGPAVDVYFDDAGRFAFHGALSIGGVFGDGFNSGSGGFGFADGALIGLDVGFSLGLSRAFKLIIEGQFFSGYGSRGFRVAEMALVNYGVRFHNDTLAVDLAFIRPIGDFDVGGLVMGIPFVSFSSRW